MLSNVQIVCFASCYTIALLLECSRLLFRVPARLIVAVTFTVMGLFLHTAYMVLRSNPDPQQAPPLSSWFDWLLLMAWGVALVYLISSIRRPAAALGIFMLPLVLALIGVASTFRDVSAFPRERAAEIGGMAHGVALLLGSVAAVVGCVAGIMYLLQSHRLKRKLPPRQGFRLPSLEWLQQANRNSLLVSSGFLAAGLLSGLGLNLAKRAEAIPWTDPVVLASAVLLVWLLALLVFEACYKPAQQGRKVAYLTLASFVFLGVALGIVLFVPTQHAAPISSSIGHADVGEAGGSQ